MARSTTAAGAKLKRAAKGASESEADRAALDAELDEALAESFPASDPPAVDRELPAKPPRRVHKR